MDKRGKKDKAVLKEMMALMEPPFLELITVKGLELLEMLALQEEDKEEVVLQGSEARLKAATEATEAQVVTLKGDLVVLVVLRNWPVAMVYL